MESNRSSNRLKQRLAWVLRSPSLLIHYSCNPSHSIATNLSSTSSSRALLNDVVHEPALIPRHQNQLAHDPGDDSLSRSRSFSSVNDSDRRPLLTAASARRSFDCSGCGQITHALESSQLLPSLMAKNNKCKDLKTRKMKERRSVTESKCTCFETGDDAGKGRTCPPVSPTSSPSKSSYCGFYCSNDGFKTKKQLSSNAYGFTSSSSMASDELGFFSSEEDSKEEETETFFSSRSLSSDSSVFYQRPSSIKKYNKKKNKKKPQCPPSRRGAKNVYDDRGRCKGFQPLVSVKSTSEKKKGEAVKEKKSGYAVMKRSRDPYGDFRRSMAEMIIERQIFGAEDLKCLLQSYLSLNSPDHYPDILQAFSDIWVVLFGHD